MKNITIAIDGYAGCGKSTTAQRVANDLDYIYIDTGAMYRSVSLYFLRHEIAFDYEHPGMIAALKDIHIAFIRNEAGDLQTEMNGEVVEKDIRSPEVSAIVSPVSVHASVRESMVAQQRRMGASKGVLLEGRDIGTVVFPDAELKVFMKAEMEVRAKRRLAEMQARGIDISLAEVIENLRERDRIDTTRAIAPLRQAADAMVLDTTHLTIDDQVRIVCKWARERMEL
ncbi:MAG: (d)CMP kinase, partial [Bacteroidota bacterium]